jgi:hypothetical protein
MKAQAGLTEIPGIPSRSQAIAGMAHFSGSGPAGAVCSKCASFILSQLKGEKSRCQKYQALTGSIGSMISGSNSACRYFEQRGA